MMGVYIKGIKKPKFCSECTIGECRVRLSKGDVNYNVHPQCPLIKVKEPHGRLIDADKLLRWLLDEWKLDIDYDGIINEVCEDVIDAIQNAPTVIEGEE